MSEGLEPIYADAVGVGYTLATGRLFAPWADVQAYAEILLERPVFTHEFADKAVWTEIRAAFENRQRQRLTKETAK